MEEKELKAVAQQLRQPQGDVGIQVGEKMNEGNRLMNLHTIEALQLQDEDRLLEIGMGNGFFVKDILSKANSINYSGCDFSPEMVEEAKKRNKKFIENGQVNFHLTNAEQLPFKENSFHKIFTINTVYFWENPQQILSEISRVLKPEGKIIIAVRPKSVMKDYPIVKYGFNVFSEEDLEKLLVEKQFRIIDSFEKVEPEREFLGMKMKFSALIVTAEKIKS